MGARERQQVTSPLGLGPEDDRAKDASDGELEGFRVGVEPPHLPGSREGTSEIYERYASVIYERFIRPEIYERFIRQ